MFEYTKGRDGTCDPFVLRAVTLTTCTHYLACRCISTLKLTEQPEEREKRYWTIRGEATKGCEVELSPPREPKKAKRKDTDGAENEGDTPRKRNCSARRSISSPQSCRRSPSSCAPLGLVPLGRQPTRYPSFGRPHLNTRFLVAPPSCLCLITKQRAR